MATGRRPEETIGRWLEAEAPTQLPDRVLRATFDRTRTTRQQGAWRAALWRIHMPRFALALGGVAAIVVASVLALNYFGSSEPVPGVGGQASPSPSPSPAASPSPSGAEPSAWTGLPAGPFVITTADDPVQITVDIASPGWIAAPEFDAVIKDDDGLDPPETVGSALLAWAWPAGTDFYVYGDPCNWSTTIPETPATTPDEIAAALAAQASRDATTPVDVTIGGYAGKTVTLHVPMSYEIPGATRDEEFAACDGGQFGSYAAGGDTEPSRNHQGPGQVDEFWILDVDGAIVILDAMYGPAVPAELVDEMRAIAGSATFATP